MSRSNGKLKIRPNTITENHIVLEEIKARKEIDTRSFSELEQLFLKINAKCDSGFAHKKTETHAARTQKIQYGPIEGSPPNKWWGIRMDCSRDNVHKPFNENVDDGPFGALSLCTSHINTHNDVDWGDYLTCTGREYRSKESLVLSYKNKVPLRLIRSYCLTNPQAPKTGYRYDGLFTVVSHWVGRNDSDGKQFHKFALAKVRNQEKESRKVMRKNVTQMFTRRRSNIMNFVKQKSNSSLITSKKFMNENCRPKRTNASSIVSRQSFDKDKPDTSADTVGKDSDTNIFIRTGFYNSFPENSPFFQMIGEIKSEPEDSYDEKQSFSEKSEIEEPEEMSPGMIYSLSPDKVVDLIDKAKDHPMAKLLIASMIGIRQENLRNCYDAYEVLTSKVEQKLVAVKQKCCKKLKKQRREIANLVIDAKFNAVRSSRHSKRDLLKLMQRRKLQKPRNAKNDKKRVKRLKSSDKKEKIVKKTTRMVNCGVQCSLIPNQVVKVKTLSNFNAGSRNSAFVPVNRAANGVSIDRLRSIGFKPIRDTVDYMSENLNFEDLEKEDDVVDQFFKLTEEDFERPWHGWAVVTVNGKRLWTGH